MTGIHNYMFNKELSVSNHINNSPNSMLILSIISLQGIFNLVVGMKGIYFLINKAKLLSLLYFPYEIIVAIYDKPEIILYILGFVLAIALYALSPFILVRTNIEKRLAKWTLITSIIASWIYMTALTHTIKTV